MKRVFFVLVCLSVWLFALPPAIEKAIKRSGIPKSDLSIYIKEAGDGRRIVASLNTNKIRTPASVIKVLTTYAALSELGFDYRWPTQVYMSGRLKRGVLHGDLIVKGYGDPSLDSEDVEEMAQKVHAAGIRKITGAIVIDRSYFRVGSKNSSHFDENLYSPYNAMPDAMMFNRRVSTVCVIPNRNEVKKRDPDASYVLHNELKRVDKPCRGRYAWPQVKIEERGGVSHLHLKGTISKRCGKREICKVLTKPYKSFYYAFKSALKRHGTEVHGSMRLRKVPSRARLLFTHFSEPLEKIVSHTAKKSDNLYARHLLLLLGAKRYGAPATVEKGRRAVEEILKHIGAVGSEKLKIDNGSGLSRRARLSAKTLAGVLDHAYERYGMRWMKTLSIAGVDGTIKRRFRGTVVKANAWMKTGTLKRVKNIAGYVKSKQGVYYTVVIIANTAKGRWRASKLQNEIVIWLRTYKKGKRSKQKPMSVSLNGSGYYIQAGAFSKYPSEAYIKRLGTFSLPFSVKREERYKVLIGPYTNERQAREILKKVKERINVHAFIVRR